MDLRKELLKLNLGPLKEYDLSLSLRDWIVMKWKYKTGKNATIEDLLFENGKLILNHVSVSIDTGSNETTLLFLEMPNNLHPMNH